MAKGKIGVQMFTVKSKIEELGVYETMKKISELGYHAVEVSQVPMTPENVAEIKRRVKNLILRLRRCLQVLNQCFQVHQEKHFNMILIKS